jgi:hypothetical protein
MSLRSLLVALIVVATGAFVVGTAIERTSGEQHHDEKAAVTKPAGEAPGGETGEAHSEASGETGGEIAGAHAPQGSGEGARAELRPLGIDIEAAPFVALAAAGSLALALGAWLRPRWALLLLAVAAAMIVFGALDVREVFHQHDEGRTGLAVLAGCVALLHLAAAAVAALMGRAARRPAAGTAVTIGA